MNKKVFEDELMTGMHRELVKQASGGVPDLSKAAECLHAAMEIFEEQGLDAQANQVLQVLHKIAAAQKTRPVQEMPSIQKIMEAGITQRDLQEFNRGNPVAKAKLNMALRHLGMSEHQIAKFLGPKNVMTEEEAKTVADPNRSFSKIWEWTKNPQAPDEPDKPQPGDVVGFDSIAFPKKPKHPGRPDKIHDAAVPKNSHEAVKNMEQYGMPLKPTMADDGFTVPPKKDKLSKDDMDADFAGLLDSPTFDIDASDDELMGMEIKEDSLEVFDSEEAMSDFEDERH